MSYDAQLTLFFLGGVIILWTRFFWTLWKNPYPKSKK